MDELFVGDLRRLQQCLNNGVSNAIKFTDKGGAVSVRAQIGADAERQISAAVAEDWKALSASSVMVDGTAAAPASSNSPTDVTVDATAIAPAPYPSNESQQPMPLVAIAKAASPLVAKTAALLGGKASASCLIGAGNRTACSGAAPNSATPLPSSRESAGRELLTITVSDNGVGLTREDLSTLQEGIAFSQVMAHVLLSPAERCVQERCFSACCAMRKAVASFSASRPIFRSLLVPECLATSSLADRSLTCPPPPLPCARPPLIALAALSRPPAALPNQPPTPTTTTTGCAGIGGQG
jgi:hypothetical protein